MRSLELCTRLGVAEIELLIAHSDGQSLVPDEPVQLLHELALEFAAKMTGKYPPDLAKNHVHYLHGRQERP